MTYIIQPSSVFSALGREKEIRRLEKRIALWVRNSPPSIRPMLHHQFNGLTKCFRPLTLFACYHAQTDEEVPESLIVLAHVIEIVHNISLVIDDIVDKSDTRRGKPTLHFKYDEMTAYMVSAYLISEAYRILRQEVADEFFAMRRSGSGHNTPIYDDGYKVVHPNDGTVDAPNSSVLDLDGLPDKKTQLALRLDDPNGGGKPSGVIHAARTDMRLISELLERLATAEIIQWDSRKDGTLRKIMRPQKPGSLNLGLKDWRVLAREDTGSMFEICACLGARSQGFRQVGRLIGMLYHASDDLCDLEDANKTQKRAALLSGGGDQDIIDGILTLPAALAIQQSRSIRRLFWTHPLQPGSVAYNNLLRAFRAQKQPAQREFEKIKSDAYAAVKKLAPVNPEPIEALIEQVALLAPP